jgi:hypothetical protein
MTRRRRTRAELIDASEHVCYEIWMMHHMGKALTAGMAGSGPIHNAFTNSFALHVRNLIEFLYETKTVAKNDAIVAEDYFSPPGVWTSIRLNQPPALKHAEIQCEKQIAHLTYTRDKKQPLNFVLIVGALQGPLTVFMANVDRSLLGGDFKAIEHLFRQN